MRFANLRNKKVFLTGGTGFFGKSILARLKDGWLADTEFTILSRDPGRFLAACPEFRGLDRVRFLAGDVRDFAFPRERFDAVVHAAAPASCAVPPGGMRAVIAGGTLRTLDFARRCGAERLLFVSSGAVYGPGLRAPAPEDAPLRPATEYGIAKRDAEEMCLESAVPSVIARCFAFIGPYLNRDIHFAAGNFIRDCLAGRPIVIRGDGTPVRSYLYADDLVEWLFTLLDRGRPGRAYNVGSDEAVTIAGLAAAAREALGGAAGIRVLGRAVPGAAHCYVPDIGRARRELGLSVRTPLADALRKAAGARPTQKENTP